MNVREIYLHFSELIRAWKNVNIVNLLCYNLELLGSSDKNPYVKLA